MTARWASTVQARRHQVTYFSKHSNMLIKDIFIKMLFPFQAWIWFYLHLSLSDTPVSVT